MPMDNAFIATTFDWDHRTPTDWQRFANKVLRKLRIGAQLTPVPGNMANVEARMNLFHLLEQTVANKVPGDVVDVGGKSGVVESITMRTVALRSYDGAVHTVPYSSIDTITNMTKDFSYAVLEIGIAYHEDVDNVMQVMKEVDAALRREWPYRRTILRPLEIAGVDALGDSSVMIKARSMVRAGEQWGVRREMIRRLKKRFDELGIEIPFPHRTLYFGTDKDGNAPPLFIEQHRKAILENVSEPAEQKS